MSDFLMFWGMREDRQHLAMSLHCLTTSQPRLAGFWLILCMTRLCPSCHGKFTLCHHLGGAHVGTALQKRSSVSTQILAFFGEGMCKGRWYKTSYVHIGKMGKSEKISLFSKRKLFDFFFPSPLLELYSYLFLLEGGIATQANIFQCQPDLKAWFIFPVWFSTVSPVWGQVTR